MLELDTVVGRGCDIQAREEKEDEEGVERARRERGGARILERRRRRL